MSQSPSQFNVSGVNGAQQCDCRRHHSSSLVCVRSVACLDFYRFHQYKTDVIHLTLTLKMTTAQVVETSVTVNNNSPIQDYVHPDDQTQPTFEIEFVHNDVDLKNRAKKVMFNKRAGGFYHTPIKPDPRVY